MTVCFDFTDAKTSQHFNASFVEDAVHLSVHSMHGAVGSLLFPLNLQSVNLYNRTAKLLLGDMYSAAINSDQPSIHYGLH